jgi:hypothetical protein
MRCRLSGGDIHGAQIAWVCDRRAGVALQSIIAPCCRQQMSAAARNLVTCTVRMGAGIAKPALTTVSLAGQCNFLTDPK